MCEWLKKIFGFKCSCKHCHCGEESTTEEVKTPEAAPIAPESTPTTPETPTVETPSVETPVSSDSDHTDNL